MKKLILFVIIAIQVSIITAHMEAKHVQTKAEFKQTKIEFAQTKTKAVQTEAGVGQTVAGVGQMVAKPSQTKAQLAQMKQEAEQARTQATQSSNGAKQIQDGATQTKKVSQPTEDGAKQTKTGAELKKTRTDQKKTEAEQTKAGREKVEDERSELDLAIRKIGTALMATKALYIDTTNTMALTDAAIKAMMEQLDPHSSYSNAEETKKITEPLNSNFEGIGVQFNIIKDTLVVLQTVANGPSEKAGLLAGDRIVLVNDTIIAGVKMPREQIMKKLRGPKGTLVTIGVRRRGVAETIPFRIVRDKIPLHSLDAAYIIAPEIGYIRLSSFAVSTRKELREAISDLQKQGMKSLILDLAQNGGGYLEAASGVASEFLQKDDLVVYTDGRSMPKKRFTASGDGLMPEGKLVVLVDQYTASAAEIVSGAIQDHDRGLVVGRRTYGKGLVQQPIDLPDGSMIRLTISHYYTPSGRCIQKPYEKGKKRDYEEDVINRYNSGELMHIDSIHFADSLKYFTLKEHRPIYGGGGIMPDYFVPLDTTVYTRYYRNLDLKNVILNTYLAYFDNHRDLFKSKYKDFNKYKRSFDVPMDIIDSIMQEGEKMSVKPKDDAEKAQTIPMLKLTIKALIARDIWDISQYFAIINDKNQLIKKALELIQQPQSIAEAAKH